MIQDRERFPIGERLRLGQQRKMLRGSNVALFRFEHMDLPRTDARDGSHLSRDPVHVPTPPPS